MQTTSPSLLPIFRSRGLADLLTYLFVLHPEERISLSALAQNLGLATSTVQREVEKLEASGLVTSERWGNLRLVRADDESPYYEDLKSLLLKAFGPVSVVREAFAGVSGIDRAYLFGSWASRYAGEPGPPPKDVDVLVIGNPSLKEIDAACLDAERRLGRPVNPTVLAEDTWRKSRTGFVRTVRSRPLIPIE